MKKHTPGPWTVEIQAEPEGDEPVVYVCHAGTVCDVTTVCNLLPSSAASVEQRQANARLIAAAPDLLEALEKINNVALGHPYAGTTCGDIARAAIAKAKGSPE